MENNYQKKKIRLKKIRRVYSYLSNDEFDDNVLASSNEQISTILNGFNTKISSLTHNNHPISHTFAYCILQAKIAELCDVCFHNLTLANVDIGDKKVLTSYYSNSPKIIHCLECNYHQEKPHNCIWCMSMLCNECCPYYHIPN